MTDAVHPTSGADTSPASAVATIHTSLGATFPVFRAEGPSGPMTVVKVEHLPGLLGIADGPLHDRLLADIDSGEAYFDASTAGVVLPMRVALPPPPLATSLCPQLVANCTPEVRVAFDDIASMVCDEPRWHIRADLLIGECIGALDTWQDRMTEQQLGIVICAAITLAFENIGAREIVCLEQAILLALCHHRCWREAGLKWLEGAGEWPRICVASSPNFRRIVHHVRQLHTTIPAWLEGGVDG